MAKEIYDQKNLEQRRSRFLDRFEGKTSTIGKAGLLSLLQQNMPSSNINNNRMAAYLQSGLIESRQRNPQISSRVRSYQMADEEDKRSSNHSFKTDLPRRNSMQMGAMSSMSSTKSSSIPKLPKIGKGGLGFNLKSSLQLKSDKKNSFQMASKQPAQQHLEFLNLFEQRLKRMNKK